jgi:acetyl esterase/lipase
MASDPELDELVEETRRFNQLVEAFMATVPSFASADGLAELRANNGFFAGTPVDDVEQRTLPGPAGPIDARILRPSSPPKAVLLDLHGGGWCIGSAEAGDAHNAELAERAGVIVVSIDYRLAPEHPWPAGADDCEAVARWLLDHNATEWGTDRLLIGGSSAGAHLAAVTLLRLRDAGEIDRVAAANLVFGAYDLGLTPSQRDAADALVIPLATLEACYASAFPGLDREARRDPAISPLYADLTGLPPTLLTVGTLDPLLDDSLFLHERLTTAGVDTELAVYPESVHGFPAFPTAMGRHSRHRMMEWLARRAAA